jgi:hypothetical protein
MLGSKVDLKHGITSVARWARRHAYDVSQGIGSKLMLDDYRRLLEAMKEDA